MVHVYNLLLNVIRLDCLAYNLAAYFAALHQPYQYHQEHPMRYDLAEYEAKLV